MLFSTTSIVFESALRVELPHTLSNEITSFWESVRPLGFYVLTLSPSCAKSLSHRSEDRGRDDDTSLCDTPALGARREEKQWSLVLSACLSLRDTSALQTGWGKGSLGPSVLRMSSPR